MYPEHVGLGAAPAAPITPITPTPSHWGILTAGDVQAEQARTLTSAQQTDAAVQACTGLDPTVKAQWGVFLAALTAWCQTPMANVWTPWMPSDAVVVTGDTGNTMMAWEAQLQGWQQRLAGSCSNVAPLAQFNPQPPPGLESQVTQWLRYGAVIAGFVGTAYVVAKVAEFVPHPAPRAAPKPAPAHVPAKAA